MIEIQGWRILVIFFAVSVFSYSLGWRLGYSEKKSRAFSRARKTMRDRFFKDSDLKITYLHNIALVIYDQTEQMPGGPMKQTERMFLAKAILDRIFEDEQE